MNHCKTCKHWNRHRPEGETFGSCELMLSSSNEDGVSSPDRGEVLAYGASAVTKTMTWVKTHPYFGCVMWEAQ